MFTVKATYRTETRRFTFPDSVLFPTYEELQGQLCRIFHISHCYYLARLIFSPDASSPGRILVGKEVHSAKDYDSRVAPLRRLWPNPLLRFTVCVDGAPTEISQLSLYRAPTVPSSERSSMLPSPAVSHQYGMLSPIPHSCTPPPPLPPQPFVSCVFPSPPPPCKMSPAPLPSMYFPTSSKPCSPRECGTTRTPPCCSIAKGKADIQILLASFKEDIERILCRTFGTDYLEEPSDPNVEGSGCRIPGIDAIPHQTATPPVSTSANTLSQWCFVCKNSFTGVWYGCVKCPWHAVCPGCFSKSHSAHTLSFGPSHVVQQHAIDRSTQVAAHIIGDNNTSNSTSGNSQSPAPTPLGPTSEQELSVHSGVLCDSCSKTIVGTRHKCLDCPDYDLCTICVESGATEQHNPFHEFFDIETPGRVYVHTVRGDWDRMLGNEQQSSDREPVPVTQQGPAGSPANLPVRHSATCNLCDSAVIGERYKCVVCPDFDTCSACFTITTEQHPNHGFVKVNKPEDLMMRDSIALRQIAHLAICDSCRKTIRGFRYKCMHPDCADFDLCSGCESLPIPVHPSNHPMLKLKTSDTIIPTVYRVGQSQMVDEPPSTRSTAACGESRSPIVPSAVVTERSPELRPVVVSGQVTGVTSEDQIPLGEEFLSPLGSPAGEALRVPPVSVTRTPSHLLVDVADPLESPRSNSQALDIYHQLWPKVNQEMIHLNATEAREASDSAVNSVANADTQSTGTKSLVAEESAPGSPVTSSAYQRSGTCPVSPVLSTKSIIDGYRTPSSMPSKDQESHRSVRQSPAHDQQEIVVLDAPLQRSLDAVLVGDTNVPDGQIFPPGAEFVKGWHMMNNGGLPWPATTEIQFVVGEMFASECSAALRAKVGVVHPGQDLDIWTGDLKAPDVPGRYVGYWRLSDGQGHFFGNNVWIDLTVVDHHSDQGSEQSLAASSMVMPSAQPTDSVSASDEPHDAPQPSLPSTKTVTDDVEDRESDISSVSLVSVPTSDDEDTDWQDTRTHSEPLEYVVLYDNNLDPE